MKDIKTREITGKWSRLLLHFHARDIVPARQLIKERERERERDGRLATNSNTSNKNSKEIERSKVCMFLFGCNYYPFKLLLWVHLGSC